MGVLALAWIVTYWWWEPRRTPPITFAGLDTEASEPPAAERTRPQPPRSTDARPTIPAVVSVPGASPIVPAESPAPVVKAESAAPEPSPAPPSPREHTVRRGDTLSGISQRYYGTTRHADLLYRENKSRLRLRSADAISPGDVLVIPPLPADAGR